MVKTYEGFMDWFRKKKNGRKGDQVTGRLPRDIESGSGVSKNLISFFENTDASDFEYIIKEISDEYGGGEISYILETEFATVMVKKVDDEFFIDPADLKFMDTSQECFLQRVGKYANLSVYIDGFKFEDEIVDDVNETAERLLDMCPEIQSYIIGKFDIDEHYKSNKCIVKFNF